MEDKEFQTKFTVLLNNAKGDGLKTVISQVLTNSTIYRFKWVINHPNVSAIKGTKLEKYLNTLNLFAYGMYSEYLKNKTNYIELETKQIDKLKLLTVMSMSYQKKVD